VSLLPLGPNPKVMLRLADVGWNKSLPAAYTASWTLATVNLRKSICVGQKLSAFGVPTSS